MSQVIDSRADVTGDLASPVGAGAVLSSVVAVGSTTDREASLFCFYGEADLSNGSLLCVYALLSHFMGLANGQEGRPPF